MNRSALLFEAVQAHKMFASLWQQAKPYLLQGQRLVISIKPESRSQAQNALLHASLSDIAAQVEWAGRKRDPDIWKRLLTAAWLRARGEGVEVLPALDGRGVDVVFRKTSDLSRAECSELQEFVHAWGAEQGVRFTAPEYAEA